jgi:acetyl-CoA carboxylase biotin carboxyl carrier protein
VELKQIEKLMEAMGRTGTKRLSITKEGFEITLEREEQSQTLFASNFLELDETQKMAQARQRANQALSHASDGIGGLLTGTAAPIPDIKEPVKGSFVTSPMVGTFYASASPTDAPFIKIGDRVEKNTLVCIIEAMKVMNEIKASITGVVAEVLVESGQPVEFGTKLFRIVE